MIFVVGRGLYCPFWKFTGLLCPGCGVTRMCLALLRLDLAGAWRANPALLLALPVPVSYTHLITCAHSPCSDKNSASIRLPPLH